MKFIVKLVRQAVAALSGELIHLATGIIVVCLMGKAFGYHIPIWFYPVGALLGALPDIDCFYHTWQVRRGKRKFYETHRLVPHYPVIILLISAVLVTLAFFWLILFYWAAVVALCLLSHAVIDSIGAKVRWFAPCSKPWGKKYYGFFARKDGKMHIIVSWSEEEWHAWVRALKEKPREGTMDRFGLHIEIKKNETIAGVALLIIAILLILFW